MRRIVLLVVVIMMLMLVTIPVLAVAMAPPINVSAQTMVKQDACRSGPSVTTTMAASSLTNPTSEQSPVQAYMETGWRSPRGGPITMVVGSTLKSNPPMQSLKVAIEMTPVTPDEPIIVASSPPTNIGGGKNVTMTMTRVNLTSKIVNITRSTELVTDYGRGARTAPVSGSVLSSALSPGLGLHSRESGVIAQMTMIESGFVSSQSRDNQFVSIATPKSVTMEQQCTVKTTMATTCSSAAV